MKRVLYAVSVSLLAAGVCLIAFFSIHAKYAYAASGALSLNFCPLRAAARAFPARMASPRWGRHCAATVNGLRMHYLERSPSDGGGGGDGFAPDTGVLALEGSDDSLCWDVLELVPPIGECPDGPCFD